MSPDDPSQRAQGGASIRLLAGSPDASAHLEDLSSQDAGFDTRFPIHAGTHTRRSLVVPLKSNHTDFIATHVAHDNVPHQRTFLTSDVDYFDVADGDKLTATVDFVGGVSPPLLQCSPCATPPCSTARNMSCEQSCEKVERWSVSGDTWGRATG